MNKYCVILKGANVALVTRHWLRRRRENCGFYTTRCVVAEDEVAAEAVAIALVRAELKDSHMAAFEGDTIAVRLDSIREVSSFQDSAVPGGGFTFFRAGT
jgi:hypothetical protein